MPEVHLPHLEDHKETPARAKGKFKIPKLLLEVVLISAGVFLGLAGEQWRENSHKRELAETALRGLRLELETNRKAVAAKKDYRLSKNKELHAYFGSDPIHRRSVSFDGIQVVFFEHAAWDLSLATGSLANINQQLAYSLAHLYNKQQFYGSLSQGLTQTMYARTPYLSENRDGFLGAVAVYYDDITGLDPDLIAMYDDLIPKLDRAIQ